MSKSTVFSMILSISLLWVSISSYAIENCSSDQKAYVLAAATSSKHTAYLDCHLSLSATDIITKRIMIQGNEASNMNLDCNNALIDMESGINAGIFTHSHNTIAIQSIPLSDGTWSVPHDITLKDCRVKGNIRIIGMGSNGEAAEVKSSSITAGHTTRANNAAPHNILLDNMNIESVVRTPLYLAPGVHHVTLQDSEIQGTSTSVAIYLDAESNYNSIINNYIHADGPREVMAIDGSAYNTIKENTFSAINNGGIFLYRNCGEGGTVRHQTPSHNVIETNYFYYNQYTGDNAAIYISSRNGNKSYCGDDSSAQLSNTSSTDDNDNASYNSVRYNQFLDREPLYYIKFGANTNDTSLNESTTYANIRVSQFRGGTVPSIEDFDCLIYGNSSGCYKYITCPSNKVNASVKAACNLEYGTVSSSDVPLWGHIDVIRQSDNTSSSECYVNGVSINTENRHTHVGGSYGNATYVGCKEQDNNGGDCHIKGQQICL
ncbi:hypothetical protein [Shewanella surugensis]|uniref:Right-handed parallel beta-helix repeat-containing protein n=1 Tax=Shewanella surugensis TaxID=212020 RepID=A0ABT0LIP0_9GAMM|nr:hypothetical protein [Shewanella surugensis]MCL1127556.1 hypothetical protein [Shewanella surugensis]